MSTFPCSLTRNATSHSMDNVAFHSLLRWKMITPTILATPLIQFLFKRLGECTFGALGVKRLKLITSWSERVMHDHIFTRMPFVVEVILTQEQI